MKAKRTFGRKILPASLLALSAVISAPAFAFAEESSGLSLIIPEMTEFIPMLIAFLVVFFILAKFAWPVITGIVDKREKQIKDDLTKAEVARIEGEKILDEYKLQLEDAKSQAAQIIADAKVSAEAVKAEITAKAQEEAAIMADKAKASIEAERKAAVADLQKSAAELSVAVAGKLIGQNLSDTEHRKIIEQYVAEAGSFNAD